MKKCLYKICAVLLLLAGSFSCIPGRKNEVNSDIVYAREATEYAKDITAYAGEITEDLDQITEYAQEITEYAEFLVRYQYSEWIDGIYVSELRTQDYIDEQLRINDELTLNLDEIIAKVAIGGGVVILAVISIPMTGGLTGPLVATMVIGSAADAAMDSAIGGTLKYIESGGDMTQVLYSAVEGAADGFMWSAVIVPVVRPIEKAVLIHKNRRTGRIAQKALSSSDELNTTQRVVSFNESTKRTPKTGGTWTGERGNSVFKPDLDKAPNVFNYDPPKTWRDIIKGNKDFIHKDKNIPENIKNRLNDVYDRIINGDEGIPFKDGDIDLNKLSITDVEIKDFTADRYYGGNMDKADILASEKFNMSPEEFYKWRNDNELMWHECSDRKTMSLISHDIHDNIPHTGGISEQKAINANL